MLLLNQTNKIIDVKKSYHGCFIGELVNKQREKPEEYEDYIVQVNYKDYKIIHYYNPAVKNYHKAQDSSGIYINNNELFLMIADGVSYVNNTLDNDSGKVSGELVKNIHNIKSDLHKDTKFKKIKDVSQQYLSKYIGASTLTLSKINEKNLDTIFIGTAGDIPQNLILQSKSKSYIKNQSQGFLPINFIPTYTSNKLDNEYLILLRSDGVVLKDKKDIFNLSKNLKDISIVKNTIRELIDIDSDDQTLIIIMKSCY